MLRVYGRLSPTGHECDPREMIATAEDIRRRSKVQEAMDQVQDVVPAKKAAPNLYHFLYHSPTAENDESPDAVTPSDSTLSIAGAGLEPATPAL